MGFSLSMLPTNKQQWHMILYPFHMNLDVLLSSAKHARNHMMQDGDKFYIYFSGSCSLVMCFLAEVLFFWGSWFCFFLIIIKTQIIILSMFTGLVNHAPLEMLLVSSSACFCCSHVTVSSAHTGKHKSSEMWRLTNRVSQTWAHTSTQTHKHTHSSRLWGGLGNCLARQVSLRRFACHSNTAEQE